MAPSPPLRPHNPDFKLSARQEQLLFAALNSNNPSTLPTSLPPSTESFTRPMSTLAAPPSQAPGSALLEGLEESSLIDYDNDFNADGVLDFDFGDITPPSKMSGKSGSTSSDGDVDHALHDKRNHDEVDKSIQGGGKRREGEEKIAKKPGRKPLTNEPTTKRKAQNRAAQRAFRERKEKHLVDLETKVDDLQKASEAANHENSMLRAQIENMSDELQAYKQRLSVTGGVSRSLSSGSAIPAYMPSKSVNNPNDFNFQFEFPRFGSLPGPPKSIEDSTTLTSPTTSRHVASPVEQNQEDARSQSMPNVNSSVATQSQSPGQFDPEIVDFSGLFSPSLQSVSRSGSDEFLKDKQNGTSIIADSVNGQWNIQATNYSSPSASSNSNAGATSSCGTSPEPSSAQSPKKMSEPSLTTIGEENINFAKSGETPLDMNGIDWLAQQNGNQFDPQLFGDYREPIDNILSNDLFINDVFLSEAFSMPNFGSPSDEAPSPAPKKDLMQQIDEKQDEDESSPLKSETLKQDQKLSASTIWDRLQTCPKVADGTFDLDSLCDDLKKKATCKETGWVLETEFNNVIRTHFDKSQMKPATETSEAN